MEVGVLDVLVVVVEEVDVDDVDVADDFDLYLLSVSVDQWHRYS